MNFEKLWEKYIEEDITEISEDIINFFKGKIPLEVLEEYDLEEVIVEFIGHHETVNNYEQIEELQNVIKTNHQSLYNETGDYFNDSLVKFYIFKENEIKLKEQVEDFLTREYDYDLLFLSLNQLMLNGYNELLDYIIINEFDRISNNTDLIEGVDYEIAVKKYYIELEKLMLKSDHHRPIDKLPFIDEMKKYNFDIKEDELQVEYLRDIWTIEKMLEESKQIVNDFSTNKEKREFALKGLFMNWMKGKNISFIISSYLWEQISFYFENRKTNKIESYYKFEEKSFRKYLSEQQGFLSDNRMDISLFIWGGEYILDFMREIEILRDQKSYEKQKDDLLTIKTEFKKSYEHYLWEMNYIHKWKPSKRDNGNEWRIEEKEFKDSYNLEINTEKFQDLKYDELFSNAFLFEEKDIKPPKIVSVRTEKKIGRNEKVTVEYLDGKIVKDIKYKKVINDIKKGDCKLI